MGHADDADDADFLTYSVRFTQIFPSSSYFENPCIGQMSYHHDINDFSILFAL